MAAGRGPETTNPAHQINMLVSLAQNGASPQTLGLLGTRFDMSGAENFVAPQPQPQPVETAAPKSPRKRAPQE